MMKRKRSTKYGLSEVITAASRAIGRKEAVLGTLFCVFVAGWTILCWAMFMQGEISPSRVLHHWSYIIPYVLLLSFLYIKAVKEELRSVISGPLFNIHGSLCIDLRDREDLHEDEDFVNDILHKYSMRTDIDLILCHVLPGPYGVAECWRVRNSGVVTRVDHLGYTDVGTALSLLSIERTAEHHVSVDSFYNKGDGHDHERAMGVRTNKQQGI